MSQRIVVNLPVEMSCTTRVLDREKWREDGGMEPILVRGRGGREGGANDMMFQFYAIKFYLSLTYVLCQIDQYLRVQS